MASSVGSLLKTQFGQSTNQLEADIIGRPPVSKLYRLPQGSWDSHVHVVDESRFPFDPDRAYTPKTANVQDLVRFESSLGIDNVCIVAMSVYKDDNRSIFDALKRLGSRARAVVCIDPQKVSQDELKSMHRQGARGVRLNLKTGNDKSSKEELKNLLHTYAALLRPLDWVLQVYITLDQVAIIADEIRKLGIRVVIDHMAHPDQTSAPQFQPGYHEFLQLLAERQVWVKLSATYRYEHLPDMEGYIRTVLRTGPTQVIWASDWPHSGSVEMNPNGDRKAPQAYRKVDDISFLNSCIELCDWNEELIHMIFVDNPGRLWKPDAP